MLEQTSWTVEIRLAYDVNAPSADQALGAVLPLVSLGVDRYGPQPKIADYTVRELSGRAQTATATADPLHGLTKAVYTAKEVAEILHVSVHTVYSRVPSMTIGGARRYTRPAVLTVLERGVERGAKPEQPAMAIYDRATRYNRPAKIVQPKREKQDSRFLTIKEAANMLRISPHKMRQLIDERKIFYFESYGRKTISREAIQHYLGGQSPRAFVEKQIAEAKDDPNWKNNLEGIERVAAEWRAKWPE